MESMVKEITANDLAAFNHRFDVMEEMILEVHRIMIAPHEEINIGNNGYMSKQSYKETLKNRLERIKSGTFNRQSSLLD